MDPLGQGRRLAAARALRGYSTRKALAEKLDTANLGSKTLGAIERGGRGLKPHEAVWIAEKLDLPRWWFEQEDLHQLGQGAGGVELAKLQSQVDKILSYLQTSSVRETVADIDTRLSGVEKAVGALSDVLLAPPSSAQSEPSSRRESGRRRQSG